MTHFSQAKIIQLIIPNSIKHMMCSRLNKEPACSPNKAISKSPNKLKKLSSNLKSKLKNRKNYVPPEISLDLTIQERFEHKSYDNRNICKEQGSTAPVDQKTVAKYRTISKVTVPNMRTQYTKKSYSDSKNSNIKKKLCPISSRKQSNVLMRRFNSSSQLHIKLIA